MRCLELAPRVWKRASFRCLFSCVVLLFSTTLVAQTKPDTGILLQEQRQQAPSLPERPPEKEAQEAVQPVQPDTGVKMLVIGFRFSGDYKSLASERELQRLVQVNVGKELSFGQLQDVVAAVTRYLRKERRYLLARAYLPKQEVLDGVVEISVLGGRVDGEVKLEMSESARIRRGLVSSIASKAIRGDRPARMEDLERAMLLIGDLPGMEAQASLAPGLANGTTKVTVHAFENGPFHGGVTGDNYGDRYTGMYRGTGQFSVDDPFGWADQVTVGYTQAERMKQWQVGYSLPVGATGLILNTSYSGLTYTLGKELAVLKEEGTAHVVSSGVNYPLLRTRNRSLWVGGGMEYMTLTDRASGVKTRDRKLVNGTASLSGSFYDRFGGGGLTSASLIFTGGSVDLSGAALNRESDIAGPQTEGGFARVSYFLARLQRLTSRTTLYAAMRGQLSPHNLDSSQKFILGGPSGVRAYPVGEAPGDGGHSLTLETRYDVPSMPRWATTQLVGFFDGGWVKLHSSTWPGAVVNSSGRNDYMLSGAGLGLNVGMPGVYSIRASYTHALGRNEGRTIWGNNADNRNDQGRFWVQLLIWFQERDRD